MGRNGDLVPKGHNQYISYGVRRGRRGTRVVGTQSVIRSLHSGHVLTRCSAMPWWRIRPACRDHPGRVSTVWRMLRSGAMSTRSPRTLVASLRCARRSMCSLLSCHLLASACSNVVPDRVPGVQVACLVPYTKFIARSSDSNLFRIADVKWVHSFVSFRSRLP